MQRYFVNEIKNDIVSLDKDQLHHIKNVMRMKENDEITCVYNQEVYLCYVANISPFEVKVKQKLDENHELKNKITLMYCLPKGEKLDLVVQKATELGVYEIILVQSSRCIAKITNENKDKKLARFNKIALEASEQSKRNIVPTIKDVISYKDISKYHFDHQYIAYENEDEISFLNRISQIKENESVCVLIGSEGGFSLEEVEYANKVGYTSISLGKRILRSETAVFYALSSLALVLEKD
jgi:16S rRNA (uracil1498-N3)-methyltransferase